MTFLVLLQSIIPGTGIDMYMGGKTFLRVSWEWSFVGANHRLASSAAMHSRRIPQPLLSSNRQSGCHSSYICPWCSVRVHYMVWWCDGWCIANNLRRAHLSPPNDDGSGWNASSAADADQPFGALIATHWEKDEQAAMAAAAAAAMAASGWWWWWWLA